MPVLRFDLTMAWGRGDYRAIAEAIDTGSDRPDTSRALIVFNVSPDPLSGLVVFRVDMPWRAGRDLPPITITHLQTGRHYAATVNERSFDPPTESEGHGRLRFELWFPVSHVPALGWDTYIAEYAAAATHAHVAEALWIVSERDYRVLETQRHAGELPIRLSTVPVV